MRFKYLVTIIIASILLPASAFAVETSESTQHQPDAPKPRTEATTLDPVTVIGEAVEPLSGASTLEREKLERLPVRNGSVAEAIRVLPGTQYSEQSRSSLQAGEILPPEVSISGGKTYQNNILLDGISNNNIMDPGNSDPTSMQFVPEHPQSIFLSTSLVDKITLYRYNIPASLGSFTGGVVDVKTRKPEPFLYGELNYRTTSDDWTSFHIDNEIKEDFNSSNRSTFQPEFERHNGGFLLNTPINNKTSLLTAYNINYSEIPLSHFLASKTQKRRNENYLAKLAYDLNSSTSLMASINYAPYKGEHFYPNSLNSDFTIKGGGLIANLELEKNFRIGTLNLQGGWKQNTNKRSAPADLRPWRAELADGSPSSKPWGLLVGTTSGKTPASYEGSVGSLKTKQESFIFNADFEGRAIPTPGATHQINAGIEFENARGKLNRYEPTSQYFLAQLDTAGTFDCSSGVTYCVENEQYFNRRNQFEADNSTATINLLEVYLEDTVKLERLETRAGVRVSYDDFMENTNIAPRLSVNYDLFGNGKTILIGGFSRYYGRSLLAYKLREGSQPSQGQELKLDPDTGEYVWLDRFFINESKGVYVDYRGRPYVYSSLKTPYSDERVLGFNQELLGGRMELTWVHRNGKDEFAREVVELPDVLYDYKDDVYYDYLKKNYRLTNNGSSEHDELTLEWTKVWNKHYLSANLTYQDSTTSNENYNDEFYDEELQETIWFDGNYIMREDLSRTDFNRPWTAKVVYTAKLPYNFTFTNVTIYRSGYEGLDKLSDEERDALEISVDDAYQVAKKSDSWVFDWRLDWDIEVQQNQILQLTVEANNIFNEKVSTGDPTEQLKYDTYELGRQVWLGATYKF